jgi:hypothetical protein
MNLQPDMKNVLETRFLVPKLSLGTRKPATHLRNPVFRDKR